MKRGKGVGKGTGPEGEERGKKGGRKGARKRTQKARILAPYDLSRGIKRDKLNGTNGAKFAVFFLQIFADFCRFSLFLGIIAFGRRRSSQKPVCPI